MLTGNLDWVGNEFTFNAGAGLVISQPEGIEERNSTVVEQLRFVFERDWFSNYTRSLQANKIPICNKHQINKMVPAKGSQLDTGPAPIRTGQPSNGPAPGKHTRIDKGPTTLKTRHLDDRTSEISRQDVANRLEPIIDSYQDSRRVRMSHPDYRPMQITDYNDNVMIPQGQSVESSGSREISSGPL